MKEPTQEQVWNKISELWSKYRKKAPAEVIEFLADKKGKILDMGCASGRNLIANKRLEYYGVDFSEEMLKFAEQKSKNEKIKAAFFKSSLDELPFEDNFFDAAVFISTLHCIEQSSDRKKSLEELYRVLKKGREAIITVWNKNHNELAKKLQAREGFVNWKKDGVNYQRYYYFYDKKELENLLRKVGFKILDKKSSEVMHSKKNLVFYVKK